jgi:hypothetical protein
MNTEFTKNFKIWKTSEWMDQSAPNRSDKKKSTPRFIKWDKEMFWKVNMVYVLSIELI